MSSEIDVTAAVEAIERMAPLTYKGQRVLTTDLAATAFETEDKILRKNFDRNADRFDEGKHFFRVVGAELRALKDSTSFRGSVGRNANALILWTDRGIARHAKILETDVAWEIYERLEDRYFASSAEAAVPPPRALTTAESFLTIAQMQVEFERRQAEQAAEIKSITAQVDELKQSAAVLPSCPANAESITHIKRRVGPLYGLSPRVIDVVMRDSPYAPRPFATVRNTNENAEGTTFVVWSKKDVNAVFRRFVDECQRVTPALCTHPFVLGRFRVSQEKIAA